MLESWRWYGPLDKISLDEISQTRATGIVTSLHEIPYGEVWQIDAIETRKSLIAANNNLDLHWNVVESLPIHEDIKRGTGNLDQLFANYRQSMVNLAKAGIKTICYNFMPVVDWTRTKLDQPIAGGGTSLRFHAPLMAAFEIHMLQREGAEADYPAEVLSAAENWFNKSSNADREQLLNAIMAGLPGAYDRYDVEGLRTAIATYDGIGRDELRSNFARWLSEVIPTAQELGIKMCVHPDDPPRDILGLPRIMSNREDIAWLYAQQDANENGLTLCSGSLGANPMNDVPQIAKEFSDRIHFAHLRNVRKDPDGSFEEAAHLDGDTNMVALISVLLSEEARRKESQQSDWEIPFRPDHGHELLDDAARKTHPGYPLTGRMVGLAELRGVIAALSQ